MLCGQEALGGCADSPPPTEFTTELWRKEIGLQTPSSGTEVIYCSPEEELEEEWYDESPEPEPLSPATEKLLHDEFQKDLDECTTDSDYCDFMSGPEGKTLSETDEKIADYQRKVKECRMQAMHRHRMEGNALQYVIAPCMYLRKPLLRGGSHCAAGEAAHHATGPDAGSESVEPDASHGGAASRQCISAPQVTGT